MRTTLDEWEILQAVVQLGSFAAAAKRLNRSQSTISYAVARLQDQLGIKFFEIEGRKAKLTECGRALLVDAEPHLAGFHQLERRAGSLASGRELEVRLSIDSIFPNNRLFAALSKFSHRFPDVQLTLRQATFLSADSEFSLHNAHLCITGLLSREFFVRPILGIKMIAVAQRHHRLHASKRKLGRPDLTQHMLVTVEGSASGMLKHQPRVPTQLVLSVGSIDAAIDAVRSGLCFGWLPKYRIESELKAGEFVPLNLAMGGTREVRLNLVCKDPSSISHEVTTLAELLGINRELEEI
ncbi:MAG TPA: LysR family transcriptional regulator [Acidobacteriaceae bacterium]|nr:LysR family transcriptional regulator [Acidobacteriaceae bacterium]